jgi:hypothetical protein
VVGVAAVVVVAPIDGGDVVGSGGSGGEVVVTGVVDDDCRASPGLHAARKAPASDARKALRESSVVIPLEL